MRFRPTIFIWFVFAQYFFKFHKNDDNRKLKPWSFRLRKNDFCRLYNERTRALQSSITFFLIHPVYLYVVLIIITIFWHNNSLILKPYSLQKEPVFVATCRQAHGKMAYELRKSVSQSILTWWTWLRMTVVYISITYKEN